MVDIQMTTQQCPMCGMPFQITADKEDRLRKSHATFYCPNGHTIVFTSESEEEKLRKSLEFERSRVLSRDQSIVQLQRQLNAKTRKVKRK